MNHAWLTMKMGPVSKRS